MNMVPKRSAIGSSRHSDPTFEDGHLSPHATEPPPLERERAEPVALSWRRCQDPLLLTVQSSQTCNSRFLTNGASQRYGACSASNGRLRAKAPRRLGGGRRGHRRSSSLKFTPAVRSAYVPRSQELFGCLRQVQEEVPVCALELRWCQMAVCALSLCAGASAEVSPQVAAARCLWQLSFGACVLVSLQAAASAYGSAGYACLRMAALLLHPVRVSHVLDLHPIHTDEGAISSLLVAPGYWTQDISGFHSLGSSIVFGNLTG